MTAVRLKQDEEDLALALEREAAELEPRIRSGRALLTAASMSSTLRANHVDMMARLRALVRGLELPQEDARHFASELRGRNDK